MAASHFFAPGFDGNRHLVNVTETGLTSASALHVILKARFLLALQSFELLANLLLLKLF